jgi:membrane fusion protein (multidrug efflux system)
VPKDAVITEDAAQSVFVVDNGKARRRTIRIGYSDSANYEVVEGLKSGDEVVTTGQANLKDDARVHVVNAPGAAAPPATAQAAAPLAK